MNIRDLKEKRAQLVQEMRSVIDEAERENRGLSAEEEEKIAKIEKDIEELDALIRREERASNLKKYETTVEEVVEEVDSKRAFEKYLRFGKEALSPDELRALSTSSGPAGGYLVPTELSKQLYEVLVDNSVMRPLCKVISTSTTMNIPVVSAHAGASWVSEAGSYGGTDPVFSQVTLSAYKLGALIRVSEELVADSAIDVQAFLARELGIVFARAEDAAFIAGDGSGKPTGIVTATTNTVTTASSSAFTADELIDLYYALKPQYRKNAVFIANDAVIAAIRKMKDTTDQYIWSPGLSAGEPDKLLGRPIYSSSDMPTVQAGNKVIVFFDPSYYVIADRGALEIQVLRERYADTGQIAYRATKRVDGKLVLAEASVALKIKSSS